MARVGPWVAVMLVMATTACGGRENTPSAEKRMCEGMIEVRTVRDLLGPSTLHREPEGYFGFPDDFEQCSARARAKSGPEYYFSFAVGPVSKGPEPNPTEFWDDGATPLGPGVVGVAGDARAWVSMPACHPGSPPNWANIAATTVTAGARINPPVRSGNRALLVQTLIRLANASLDKAGCTAGRLPAP